MCRHLQDYKKSCTRRSSSSSSATMLPQPSNPRTTLAPCASLCRCHATCWLGSAFASPLSDASAQGSWARMIKGLPMKIGMLRKCSVGQLSTPVLLTPDPGRKAATRRSSSQEGQVSSVRLCPTGSSPRVTTPLAHSGNGCCCTLAAESTGRVSSLAQQVRP